MPHPERDEILDPNLEPTERRRLLETAMMFEQARPAPRPAFREALAKRVRARAAERERLLETARMLKRARPVPRPAFTEALGERLRARAAERERLLETARMLEQAQAVPRPAFRGALARHLQARSASPWRLRLLISAYAGSGLALLAAVAVGLAGVGPLGPG